MEEAFKKLQQNNQNTVDNLIKWMKDSKIVNGKEVTEEKARQLFADASDASNVEFLKFQEVISKLANEQNKSADEFFSKLAADGAQCMNQALAAVGAAASTAADKFTDVMTKK